MLSNALIEDDTEVIIMTDRSCDDGGCGFTRPGGVAYRKPRVSCLFSLSKLLIQGRLDGFSGSEKVFLFEFSMPLTNSTTFDGNMPAIWLLNAQIPLTSQYGTNADCSWCVCFEPTYSLCVQLHGSQEARWFISRGFLSLRLIASKKMC